MTTIRPSGLPPTPQGVQGQDAAKLAAAKAFFAAAMGQASAPATASGPQADAAAPGPAVRTQAAEGASAGPARIPRPGSLIDIRV